MLEHRHWICQQTEAKSCELCVQSDCQTLAFENGLGVVQCRRCGLVYVNPRPTDDELRRFYAQYLHRDMSHAWRRATVPLFSRDVKRIEKWCSTGRIFDVGCGFGFFLDLMQRRGWEVSGCDLSPQAIAYARDHLKLPNLFYGAFQDLALPPASVDVVTAWYVLHHAAEPRRVLEQAHAILRPGGLLAVRVPSIDLFRLLWLLKRFDCAALRLLLRQVRKETANPESVYNALDPPVHLYGFTPTVLKRFAASVGFRTLGLYNDGMVLRGNRFNRIFDNMVRRFGDVVSKMSGGRFEPFISFSLYAFKMPS